METYTVPTLDALKETATELVDRAAQAAPEHGSVVFGLTGDLGAGKTAFTKAVGEVLGVRESITSPTFVIQKSYTTKHDVFRTLVHIDVYRFEDGAASEELQKLNWRETIAAANTLVLVEWADRVRDILPENTHWIDIAIQNEEERIITHTTRNEYAHI